jgi:hypothetical protein
MILVALHGASCCRIKLAAQYRLPAVYPLRIFATDGSRQLDLRLSERTPLLDPLPT